MHFCLGKWLELLYNISEKKDIFKQLLNLLINDLIDVDTVTCGTLVYVILLIIRSSSCIIDIVVERNQRISSVRYFVLAEGMMMVYVQECDPYSTPGLHIATGFEFHRLTN